MRSVALVCVLFVTEFLGGVEGQTVTVRRDRDALNPPQKHVEVTEGDTLTMSCSVSNYYSQRGVYWGKSGNPQPVWLTQDSDVVTRDSRVSVNTFWRDYFNSYDYIYSIMISNISTEDAGKYICYVTWKSYYTDREGYVYVFVRNFPKEQPVCSTNQTANSTSDSVYLWCDTVKGYPGVNVTWTANGTGNDEIPDGSVVDYLDGTGQERVRAELWLNSTEWGNYWTKEFVCTVTSCEFPGLSRTCSVNVTVERVITTEAYFDWNVSPTGTSSPDSSSPGDYPHTKTTSESAPDLKGSDDPQIQGSSTVDSTLAIAFVIPALCIALFTVLICVLKRRGQRKNRQGRKTKRTTSPTGPNKAAGGEIVVPYSVTQLQYDTNAENSAADSGVSGEKMNVSPPAGQFDLTCRPYSVTTQQKQTVDGVDFSNSSYESYQPAGDVENRVSPYEVELNLNGESAFYAQIPDESTTRNIIGQHSRTDFETDRAGKSSSSATKIQTNVSRKSGGRPPKTDTPTDDFEGVDDHFIEDDSGTVVNPIYEPFKNGQGGAPVNHVPEDDEPHVYQMINYGMAK